ncbi:MAG: MgtC/SapB family protein [Myxococcaceae bacterium]|nr:MgtC/SapB family protein [Myxococcaceae bacterium]
MISHLDMMERIAAGAVMGAVIGYERDRHRRHVGLRTHLLGALASSTFMVVSAHFAYFQQYLTGEVIEVDGSRIAASVVSGIGFLAGGAILRTGVTVQGLTTAAALWLVTAIGLCCGSGMYVEGGFVTVLGIVALTVLRRFEDKNDTVQRRRVTLRMGERSVGVAQLTGVLASLGITVLDIEYERRQVSGERSAAVTFDAQIPASVTPDRPVEELELSCGANHVHIRSL